jgi:hypothetical protein
LAGVICASSRRIEIVEPCLYSLHHGHFSVWR